uniref:Phosphatidic acid phosphatase type 2/haloperoxidase domain-containing protein n=1 Tax=Eutreptiella gymnastica TaxID=73025 RepID=A0A7S4D124_9EUGL
MSTPAGMQHPSMANSHVRLLDNVVMIDPDPTAALFAKCCPKSWSRSHWWCPSYLADWLLLLILGIALLLEVTLWDPYERTYQMATLSGGAYSFNDNQFQFPHQEDTFSIAVTTIVSFLVPILFFCAYCLLQRFLWKDSAAVHDLHHSLLGICTALVIGYFAWIPINKSVGSFRPDFWERLNGGDVDEIKKGREAFPSGHTLMAFLGLGFLSFWLSGKLRVFQSTRGNVWRFFLAWICPMTLAVAQAITRVTDNRHRTVDILGGAVLGMGAAFCAYHLNYPPNYAPDCDRPKNRKYGFNDYLFSGIPSCTRPPVDEAAYHVPEPPPYVPPAYMASSSGSAPPYNYPEVEGYTYRK